MKRILLLLFLMPVISGLFAQQTIRLGIHIDPAITWLTPKNKNLDRDGMRLGIGGGLLVEYYFDKNYAIASGISFSLLGGNLIYQDSVAILTGKEGDPVSLTPGTSVAYNLSYFTIPVSLKMKTNEIGYFTYFAQFGFLPQFNTGSKANSVGKRLEKDFVGKEINLIKLSYFIGAGIEYSLGGHSSLLFGLFWDNGFTDVLSNNDYKAVNNYIKVRAGVMF
ncbi:MAG: PorT family protein [Bacteroidales bacterium]|nr:PorT family protein [Bacteroidales bacterium]